MSHLTEGLCVVWRNYSVSPTLSKDKDALTVLASAINLELVQKTASSSWEKEVGISHKNNFNQALY